MKSDEERIYCGLNNGCVQVSENQASKAEINLLSRSGTSILWPKYENKNCMIKV